jgi:hypothetical protein
MESNRHARRKLAALNRLTTRALARFLPSTFADVAKEDQPAELRRLAYRALKAGKIVPSQARLFGCVA